MAADIAESFPDAKVKLIESGGGAFEVTMDGQLVFSKLSLGRHAEADEVVNLIKIHQG